MFHKATGGLFEKTNTGRTDADGRTIWRGPRGGLFVVKDGKKAPPTKKKVSFSESRTIHVMDPIGSRGMEPGYVNRMTREQGLKMHGRLGDRIRMNDLWGNGKNGSFGTVGSYPTEIARRNAWHRQRLPGKDPWFRPVTKNGRVTFQTTYPPTDHVVMERFYRNSLS